MWPILATFFRQSWLGQRWRNSSGNNWIGGGVSRGRSIANRSHFQSVVDHISGSYHHSHPIIYQQHRNISKHEFIVDTTSTAANITAATVPQSNGKVSELADAVDIGTTVRRGHFVTIKLVWTASVNRIETGHCIWIWVSMDLTHFYFWLLSLVSLTLANIDNFDCSDGPRDIETSALFVSSVFFFFFFSPEKRRSDYTQEENNKFNIQLLISRLFNCLSLYPKTAKNKIQMISIS